MGILQTSLGINLTTSDPIKETPFSSSSDEGGGVTPPSVQTMITEGGIYMITETTLDNMVTE